VSEAAETASGRRANKRAAVFRTIGEVAENLDLPAHVLRFWESKFPQLKPLKRGGGRRYYRPEDIALLSRIRQCLYQEGYTIRGVQKLLAEGALSMSGAPAETAPSLFPLEPAPIIVAPRRVRVARRTPEGVVEIAPSPASKSLSDAGKASLEAAVRELLTARQMLDALLHRNRKN
jgi:DNA-binding transcriptional MerR regulator